MQLDYDDDYHDFTSALLTMFTSADDTAYINLDITKDIQVIPAKTEYYEIDLIRSYEYTLKYYDAFLDEWVDSVTDGTITFDTSTAVSEFTSLIFDEKCNYDTGDFTLQLDYVDQLKIFTDFEFTLYDLDVSADPIMLSHLLHTTEPQIYRIEPLAGDSYSGDDPAYDVANDHFSYSFRYYNSDTH